MKNKLSLKAAAVTVIILLFSMTACGRTENNIRFGAAETGGNYYIFACALADCLETDAGIDTDVKATAGSAANLRLLSENYIQLGLSQTDVISGMVSSGSPEEGEDGEKDYSKGYSAIAGLYTEACQIVVKADSGIESVYDLRARSVSVGEEESGSEQTAKQILQAYGLNEKLVDIKYLNYSEAADALKSGEIEAFFCMASIPTTVIEQLAPETGIRLISVNGNEAEALVESCDYYTRYMIPEGTYTGQTESVETIGVRAVLLAQDGLSADTVEKITEILFAHSDELVKSIPVSFVLSEEEAVKNIPIRFHKGAAAYYSSKGISVDAEQ